MNLKHRCEAKVAKYSIDRRG